MLSSNMHPTLASAYIECLKDLFKYGQHVASVKDPASVASNWGKGDRPSIEVIGYQFQVNDPNSCLFFSTERVLRLPYLYGLFIWTIAGSNEVSWLHYYHPLAAKFSDDSRYLCGAFGKRLFDYRDSVNQIDEICELLQRDPTSRRTFAAICTPEDNILKSKEYPCCIGVQYFLRDGLLNTITHMRAQSVLSVLPYDSFIFMMLQCLLAERLGIKAGIYTHNAGTFHMYESEISEAKRVLSKGIEPITVGPITSAESDLKDIFAFEHEVRQATINKNLHKVKELASNKYTTQNFWAQAKVVLLAHSLAVFELYDDSIQVLGQLPADLKKVGEQYLNRLVSDNRPSNT